MSAEHDREFVRNFMIVLGALVAVSIGIFFLANAIADRTQGVYIEDNPLKSEIHDASPITLADNLRSGYAFI